MRKRGKKKKKTGKQERGIKLGRASHSVPGK
jgi:hypothetical protein